MAQQRNGARGAIWMAMLAALVVLAALAGPLAAARTALAAQATATPSPTTRATPQPTAHPVARGTATPAAAATLSAAASGLDLYKRMGCVGCHRLAVANGVGTFGPTHEHIATIAAGRIAAADYSGSATTVAGYLAESVSLIHISEPTRPY